MVTDVSKTENINNIISPQDSASIARAKSTLSNTLDDFLKLLTTQLKNQDPTQPFDTNQFTAQIAQLATVEQGINSNKNLETLISLYSTSQINGVVDYIGKRVEATGNNTMLINGEATISYDLAKEADSVDVTIKNLAGNIVFSGEGTKTAGRNTVYWAGKNSFNQQTMPAGMYTVTITAKDVSGKSIESTTYTSGVVTSVDIKDGKPTLMMDTLEVPLDKVLKIGLESIPQQTEGA